MALKRRISPLSRNRTQTVWMPVLKRWSGLSVSG
jgi:hypothetical protein